MRAINDQESKLFNALISGEYDNFVLVSTEFQGEETTAIATIEFDGSDYIVTPVYIAVTDKMFAAMIDPATVES